MRSAIGFALGLVSVGCGGHSSHHDAGPSMPPVLAIGAANGSVQNVFSAQASGSGSGSVGAISFSADSGSIELAGSSRAAFLYEQQAFAAQNLTLFQGFAVGPTSWDIFWLYCQLPALSDVYDEGVTGPPLAVVTASGACSTAAVTTAASVSFPALSLTTPPSIHGYTAHGPEVEVRDGRDGLVTIGGVVMPFVTFGDVDCSNGCGTPGWYELHSVAWDEANARAIFFILYMIEGSSTKVQLTYARSLPDLDDPVGVLNLDATWTATPAAPFAPRTFPGIPPPGF